MIEIDQKALSFLYKLFWSSKGWIKGQLTNEEYQYAYSKGLLHDPKDLNHNEIIASIINIKNQIPKKLVVDSFVCSLTTRRLHLRSALGSYAIVYSMTLHDFIGNHTSSCQICGNYKERKGEELNVLNFERFKFGGVRHLKPYYINFDLSEFLKYSPAAFDVDNESICILTSIIQSLRINKSSKLSDAFHSLSALPGNKNEKRNFIEIMGYLGILKVPGFLSFYEHFIPMTERKESNYSKSDWTFPSDLWLPEYGINEKAIEFWFKEYLK